MIAEPNARVGGARVTLWLPATVLLTLVGVLSIQLIGGSGEALFGVATFMAAAAAIGFGVVVVLPGKLTPAGSILMGACAPCFVSILFLAIGIEGLICILMALPILALSGSIGGMLGCLSRGDDPVEPGDRRAHLLWLLVFLGASYSLEIAVATPRRYLPTTTTIDIAAPPEVVWRHVIAFSEITGDVELPFRLGVAYPLRARIEGEGVGAIRYCTFSTGEFVEPIEVWDPPHRLAFSVQAMPPSMEELSPYDLHPWHVDHLFKSRYGQFVLEPTADGGTRLSGTTWYSHGMAPEFYWRPIADWLVHRIHRRVLEHVQACAVAQVKE